jgi:methyl-accepting chemotaxis protein
MTSTLSTQVLPPGDTLVVVASRDAVDLVIALAAGSVAATFAAILLMIVVFMAQTRKAVKSVEKMQKKFSADPAVSSLRKTAGHVEDISRALRDETERLSSSVAMLSERLAQASDRMEERIEEFNALLEVVQGEAEGAFIDGASRARGVRAGLDELVARNDSGTRRTEGRVATPVTPAQPHPPTPPMRPAVKREDPPHVEPTFEDEPGT